MGIGVRFYLFAEDGLQRISQRLMNGLASGKDAIPQLAGTKQKVANVILELDNAKPVRIDRADGTYLTFDNNGQVHNDLVASGFAAMETYRALERAGRIVTTEKVVDLSPKLIREKWERENRWTLTKADLDAIADDIWKRKKAASPKVTQAKGIAPTPPRMTWEAQEAIKEIQKQGLEHRRPAGAACLNRPSRGYRSKHLSWQKLISTQALWKAVSEAADCRLEILKRHRTGSGVWHACVDVLRWDITHHSGETTASFHERCNSKKEAEEAARRMLMENAKYFNSDHSVEASVVCDLEWYSDANEAAN